MQENTWARLRDSRLGVCARFMQPSSRISLHFCTLEYGAPQINLSQVFKYSTDTVTSLGIWISVTVSNKLLPVSLSDNFYLRRGQQVNNSSFSSYLFFSSSYFNRLGMTLCVGKMCLFLLPLCLTWKGIGKMTTNSWTFTSVCWPVLQSSNKGVKKLTLVTYTGCDWDTI